MNHLLIRKRLEWENHMMIELLCASPMIKEKKFHRHSLLTVSFALNFQEFVRFIVPLEHHVASNSLFV